MCDRDTHWVLGNRQSSDDVFVSCMLSVDDGPGICGVSCWRRQTYPMSLSRSSELSTTGPPVSETPSAGSSSAQKQDARLASPED